MNLFTGVDGFWHRLTLVHDQCQLGSHRSTFWST